MPWTAYLPALLQGALLTLGVALGMRGFNRHSRML